MNAPSRIEELEQQLAGIKDPAAAIRLRHELGRRLMEMEMLSPAQRYLDEAVDLAHERQDQELLCSGYLLCGRLFGLEQRWSEAAKMLEIVEKSASKLKRNDWLLQVDLELTVLWYGKGDDLAAQASLNELSRHEADLKPAEMLFRYRLAKTWINRSAQDGLLALETAQQEDRLPWLLDAQLALGVLYLSAGDDASAFRSGSEAHEAMRQLIKQAPSCYQKELWQSRRRQVVLRGLEQIQSSMDPRRRAEESRSSVELKKAQLLLNNYRKLSRHYELNELLNELLATILDLVDAERAMFVLKKEDGALVEAVSNFGGTEPRLEREASRTVLNTVLTTGRMVLTGSAQTCRNLLDASSVAALKLKSILALPVKIDDEIIGALYLDHRFKENAFTDDDVELLGRYCEQFSLVVDRVAAAEERAAGFSRTKQEFQAKLRSQERELTEARAALKGRRGPAEEVIGAATSLSPIFDEIARVKDCDVPVVIWGESGTGKELIARAIHDRGNRAAGLFVALNCAALPENLLESELFGHVKGAFTGAENDRTGLFEQAHGGTLFLDEIGEMSQEMQKKLLRVLQEKEVRRLGGSEVIKVDARVIAALNKNPTELVREGKLREDLFYRLNVISLFLPPLRERVEDIPLLVKHFAKKYGRTPAAAIEVEPEALRIISCHEWPGNIRELENFVKRLLLHLSGNLVTAAAVAQELPSPEPELQENWEKLSFHEARKKLLDQFERRFVSQALTRNQGNVVAAAKEIGIQYAYLYRLAHKHQLLHEKKPPS